MIVSYWMARRCRMPVPVSRAPIVERTDFRLSTPQTRRHHKRGNSESRVAARFAEPTWASRQHQLRVSWSHDGTRYRTNLCRVRTTTTTTTITTTTIKRGREFRLPARLRLISTHSPTATNNADLPLTSCWCRGEFSADFFLSNETAQIPCRRRLRPVIRRLVV